MEGLRVAEQGGLSSRIELVGERGEGGVKQKGTEGRVTNWSGRGRFRPKNKKIDSSAGHMLSE